MQAVYLNGAIAEFGKVWHTQCETIRDIFKLIECQTPGFRQHLIKAADAGVGFEIQRGTEFLEDPEELLLTVNDEDIFITEVPAGSKGGAGKILAAVAIVAIVVGTGGFGAGATGFATLTANTAATIATSVAVNLALQGVTELMAPGPETDSAEANDGYLFNGPVNTVKEGLPVPVAYGELVVGGAPISVSFQSSPIASTAGSYIPNIGTAGPAGSASAHAGGGSFRDLGRIKRR